jgi:hypothetical protein
VIVTLQGGLANTLFQYAFGISVAKARGEEVFFTRNRVDQDVKRSYSLDAFWTHMQFVDQESDNKFHDGGPFNPDVYAAPPNTTFIGYWQTEKYFDAPLLRRRIQLRRPPSEESFRIADEIDAADQSTFLHVRRGDYVNEKRTSEFHGNLSLDYYRKAIVELKYYIVDPKIFVFSDDPDWCREQFPKDFVIVDHNHPGDGRTPGREHEDLWLMSLCRHAIMANSAFSFWGAWLGDIRKRVVLAPKQWFQDSNMNSDDIIPERWLKL